MQIIDTAFQIAEYLGAITRDASLEVIELGRDFRPQFEKACVVTLAAGIETRKFYESHLRYRLALAGRVAFSLISLAAMVASVLGEEGLAWVKQFVREQYAGADIHELWQAEEVYAHFDEEEPIAEVEVEAEVVKADISWTEDYEFDLFANLEPADEATMARYMGLEKPALLSVLED